MTLSQALGLAGKKDTDLLASSKLNKVLWCGVVWCGLVWCGVVWCDVVRCGVVWCDVVRCGVVWCGAAGLHAQSVKLSAVTAFSPWRRQVTQLTGFSDPVYAEAYVNVNQYDIVLDVLVVNQTSDTLQNLQVELATLGE